MKITYSKSSRPLLCNLFFAKTVAFQKLSVGRGRGAPTVFYNKVTEVRVVVHGDDFTFSGTKAELDRMRRKMEERYDMKIEGRWEAEKERSRR